jgi:hypothetical protein
VSPSMLTGRSAKPFLEPPTMMLALSPARTAYLQAGMVKGL